MKRRTFILGTLGGVGALAVGWSLLPPRSRLRAGHARAMQAGEVALNGWVTIGTDNRVTVLMAKSEMGQGVHTTLAMLLADELDADWSHVTTAMAPIDAIYNNIAGMVDGLPFHPDDDGLIRRATAWMTAKLMREGGVMMTGGSSSIKDLWLPMRTAGASARAMLIAAASAQWKVAPEEIVVAGGVLTHGTTHRATFGELAALAGAQPVRADVPLKSPAQFRIVGRPTSRLETSGKLAGAATFGIDVHPPGMLFASVTMCPTLGGRVQTFDAAAARALPGVREVIRVEGYNGGTGGVAAIADTPYHAMQAVRAVRVQWEHGAAAGVSSSGIMSQLAATLETDDGHAYYRRGRADDALAGAARRITAQYSAPFLAHTPMEPINCTVQVADGRATVWASTQVPDLARRAAAQAIGIDAANVDVQVQYLGGGFGRRLDVDFIGQAAAIANAAHGAPVQTIWSREEDVTHDFYRPACASRFTAGLDAAGNLLALDARSAGPAIVPQALHRLVGLPAAGIDKTTSEGAFDQPYEYPAARIAHATVPLPIPVGFWRSVGHSHQAFFVESFIDELAIAAGKDPVAFRTALLTRHARHRRVLQRVAELARWGTAVAPPAPGLRTGRGIALHQSFGSVVAQVADVSVDSEQRIRVHRVWCVVDCGFPVNPTGIRQQMEGGIIFGLSAALHGEITIVNGQVQQRNFNDVPALRMQDTPVIEVDIIPSTEPPEGVGEPGVPPIAPAVANAIFAATGTRLRSLPLRLPSAP